MDKLRDETGHKRNLKACQASSQAHNNPISYGVHVTDIPSDIEWNSGMVPEATEWDVYNNEAKKVDRELVKDWTASLNFLLLFAAIFAAVLAAFIIESKRLLEPDSMSIMVDILILYTNNLSNGTHVPYHREEFHPTREAITINCLLFGSLGFSIVAALGSVLALQWVADYDAAITRGGSSSKDRAKRRQFRFGGVTYWRMPEIIAALPLFLHLSVALFFVGVIQWMRGLSTAVGSVILAGAVTSAILYLSTTVLAVSFASAPFNTPLSRGMESLLQLPPLLGHFCSRVMPQTWSNPGSNSRLYLLPQKREDRVVRTSAKLALQAFVWVGSVVNVSPDSCQRLLLLAEGILRRPSEERQEVLLSGPWIRIMDDAGRKHLSKSTIATVTEKDIQGVCVLMRIFNHERVRRQITPASYRIKEVDLVQDDVDQRSNGTFRLLHGLPSPSVIGIRTLILLSRWRCSGKPLEIWRAIMEPYCEMLQTPSYSPPGTTHLASSFAILVDIFCKFILDLKPDNDYEVDSILRGFVEVGLAVEVPFEAARGLARAFESRVTGEMVQIPRTRIFGNIKLYISLLEGRRSDLHYLLVKLLAKTICIAPEECQEAFGREFIMMLWLAPAYSGKQSWKDVCASDDTPVAEESLNSTRLANDVAYLIPLGTILRHLAGDLTKLIKNRDLPPGSFTGADVKRLIRQIQSALGDQGFKTSDLRPCEPRKQPRSVTIVGGPEVQRQRYEQVAPAGNAITLHLIDIICRGVDFINTTDGYWRRILEDE